MSLETLQMHGFTTASFSRSVQEFTSRKLNLKQTNHLIHELVPDAKPVESLQMAYYIAGYLIQSIVKEQRTKPVSLSEYNAAIVSAIDLKDKSYNGKLFGAETMVETVSEIDENGDEVLHIVTKTTQAPSARGRVAAATGETAQQRAKVLFDNNPTLPRREMIDLFVEELEISANTGSTYFALFNKDVKRETGGKKGKRAGTSREDQVQEVFASRADWTDRKDLVNAIVAATGCSPASANTFSYKVMPSTGRSKKPAEAPAPAPTSATVLSGIKAKADAKKAPTKAAKPAAKKAPAKKAAAKKAKA